MQAKQNTPAANAANLCVEMAQGEQSLAGNVFINVKMFYYLIR